MLDAFERNATLLHHIYAYYCAGSEVFDRHVLTQREFWDFLRDADLPDEESVFLKVSDLQNFFIAANLEETAVTTEQSDINNINPDRALMRFEFIRVIARLAVAKYTGGRGILIELADNGGKPLEVRHTRWDRYWCTLPAQRRTPFHLYIP